MNVSRAVRLVTFLGAALSFGCAKSAAPPKPLEADPLQRSVSQPVPGPTQKEVPLEPTVSQPSP
jgi:hypothetical protein